MQYGWIITGALIALLAGCAPQPAEDCSEPMVSPLDFAPFCDDPLGPPG